MTAPSFAPLADNLTDFCKGLEAALNAAIAELAYDGKPARVWFGEQDKYPTTPSYAVEPVRKRRDMDSVKLQRVYDIYFHAQVICYLTKIHQGEEVVREQVDRLGDKVEEILHRDHTLGGLTMDLIVTDLESGYAYKQDSKYKAVILTVEGKSREGLPC
jgi:hypothetical protein